MPAGYFRRRIAPVQPNVAQNRLTFSPYWTSVSSRRPPRTELSPSSWHQKRTAHVFCVFFYRLNTLTKQDSYHIPLMGECIASLGDATVFSHWIVTKVTDRWRWPLTTDTRLLSHVTTVCSVLGACYSASKTAQGPYSEQST